jgi:DHA1 family multidrug resistance protein-like MFS transporter
MLLSRRARLVGLLIAAGVQNVAYTILIPFVPTLQDQFHMTALAIGVAFAGFTATKALAQPLGGWAVDRFDARLAGTTGLLLAAIATGALAYVSSGEQIVGLRLLWGLGEGLAMPAVYRLVSRLGEDTKQGAAKAMGWFGSAAVLGMTVGPGLVAIFSSVLTFQRAFLLGSALMLASAVLLAFIARPPASSTRSYGTPTTPERPLSRRLLLVFGVGLLDLINNFVYSAIEPILPLYAHNRLGVDQRTISLLFFFGLLLFALASPAGGAIASRIPALKLVTAALLVQLAALCLPTLVPGISTLAMGFLALMTAQPLVYVALRAVLTQISRTNQGTTFGWFGLISDLGWVLGPLIMTGLLGVLDSLIFAVLGALAMLGAALAWTINYQLSEPAKKNQPPLTSSSHSN